MDQDQDKFKALLNLWQEIEPRTDFNSGVWRRIELAREPQPATSWLRDAWHWLEQPAMAAAVTAVFALTIGTWGGLSAAGQSRHHTLAEVTFLGSSTLAGGYLRAASREGR